MSTMFDLKGASVFGKIKFDNVEISTESATKKRFRSTRHILSSIVHLCLGAAYLTLI